MKNFWTLPERSSSRVPSESNYASCVRGQRAPACHYNLISFVNTMGISQSLQKIPQGMADKMAENMRKMQQEQRETMMANKMAGMQKRARIERALAKARARENSKWTGGLLTFVTTAAVARRIHTGSVPAMMAVPIVALTTSTLYLVDMGWGNKVERIKADAKSILTDEGHPDDLQ
jgi:hypothetical protein